MKVAALSSKYKGVDDAVSGERMHNGIDLMTRDRPADGSDRGKRMFVLYALIRARPGITPQEVKSLTGWDDATVATASIDLERLIKDTAA